MGLVAYGLYKSRKRDWLLRFRQEHDGRDPSPAEEHLFLSVYVDHLSDLKSRAENLLSAFGHRYVEQEADLFREEGATAYATSHAGRAVATIEETAEAALTDVRREVARLGSWRPAIVQNVIGAFIYSVILLVLYIFIVIFGTGWEAFFQTLPKILSGN